ncbi:3TM-type holin [Piscinibacter sp.]|uniref:3TM-type holin n=1 Tax=Piscinibacter sp. TaxID=1903157 RepID=UPI0039E37CDD
MNPLLVGPLFDVVKQLLGGLGLDPAAKERAQLQAFELLSKGDFAQNADLQLALAQLSVNQSEAVSPGRFKGGWRPFIGWVCGGALALQFVAGPLMEWGGAVYGHPLPPLPRLDGVLWELLFGMLGLGTLRTVEKVKGSA